MSFAKRGIMYTIGGFCVSILAYLAINTLVQVVGGQGNGIWSKFECGSGSSTSMNTIPEINAVQLSGAEKGGGQLSGKLGSGTTADDVLQMLNQLKPSDMIVFESELKGARKPLMAVGKKNGQPQLLYVDRSTINSVLQDKQTSWLLNEAKAADPNVEAALQELVNEISQIIARIIASNHQLFVMITGRPEAETVSAVLGAVSKVEQCISTEGVWYGFSDICTAQQQTCNAAKCTPSGDNLVASCKCPETKCLSGGQCVNKAK